VTNMETILVVNAGSSSLKFQVFALAGEGEQRFWPQLSRDPDPFRTKETSSRVIDTSQRMLAPVIAVQDDSPAAPAPVVMPDSRIRESSAQFVPPSNRQTSASEPKKPERNLLPKRKVVVVYVKHPAIHVAQHQNPQTNW
jgi:hypothetical protein